MNRTCIIGAVIGLIVLLSGCATSQPQTQPGRPALISHAVFFKLKNPQDAAELLADCDRDLRGIPGIVAYAAGTHLDIGRAGVVNDYDVAMYMGFNSREEYQRYLDHPRHVAGVEKWKPRWQSIRIFDFSDPTP